MNFIIDLVKRKKKKTKPNVIHKTDINLNSKRKKKLENHAINKRMGNYNICKSYR